MIKMWPKRECRITKIQLLVLLPLSSRDVEDEQPFCDK